MKKTLFLLILINLSCQSGALKVIADLPTSLKEASAIETLPNSNLIWTIEDSGNKNHLYGLNTKGAIIKDIKITNATNIDWEELTTDSIGNIYIGDFGNNNLNRTIFSIYKIANPENITDSKTTSKRIDFTLPNTIKSKDFEAFFLFKNNFYMFSKEDKKAIVIRVPNQEGPHEAKLISTFNLEGKHNHITAAAISSDGKTIVLLNHNKVWKLSNFKNDAFFKGTIQSFYFKHNSQKEGVCFKNDSTLYITDEFNKKEGGNLYEFKLE